MEVRNQICNTFIVGNFFQTSTHFGVIRGKTNLNGLWSDRLIENLTPYALELHFGQGLIHDDLQKLYYDLSDRYTLTLKIKEDIEFLRGLSIKLNCGKSCKSEN
jgi:hypothetical protein